MRAGQCVGAADCGVAQRSQHACDHHRETAAPAARKRSFGFETRMLHAGHIPDAVVGARAVPIYQTTSFVVDHTEIAAQLFELKQYGNIHTRIGNPSSAVFEERIASLEGAIGAVVPRIRAHFAEGETIGPPSGARSHDSPDGVIPAVSRAPGRRPRA
ncbi:MAG TPA: PLP-dependent transferase [Gemmatimonadales bacterium]|jgi:hypothetical protein